MQVLQKGEVPEQKGFDMMCFRQHEGCSAAFRFKEKDIQFKDKGDIISEQMYIVCPTCKRKILLKKRGGGWFTPGKPVIPYD